MVSIAVFSVLERAALAKHIRWLGRRLVVLMVWYRWWLETYLIKPILVMVSNHGNKGVIHNFHNFSIFTQIVEDYNHSNVIFYSRLWSLLNVDMFPIEVHQRQTKLRQIDSILIYNHGLSHHSKWCETCQLPIHNILCTCVIANHAKCLFVLGLSLVNFNCKHPQWSWSGIKHNIRMIIIL